MPRRLLPRPPRDVGMRGSVLLLLGVIWVGVGASIAVTGDPASYEQVVMPDRVPLAGPGTCLDCHRVPRGRVGFPAAPHRQRRRRVRWALPDARLLGGRLHYLVGRLADPGGRYWLSARLAVRDHLPVHRGPHLANR